MTDLPQRNQIRDILRNRRKHLDLPTQHHASFQIAIQLLNLPLLQDAKTLAFYHAQEGEIDTKMLIDQLWQQNKTIYLPVVDKNKTRQMSFCEYHADTPLIESRHGILEPDPTHAKQIAPQHLDVVLMPLVGFDKKCHRLGRGGGYYDQAFEFLKENASSPSSCDLTTESTTTNATGNSQDTKQPIHSQQKPILIGLAFEFQKIELIESNDWDIPLQMVVTEKSIYSRTE